MKQISKISFLLLLLLLITVFILSIVAGYKSTRDFLLSFFDQQPAEKFYATFTAGKFKLLQRLTFAVICILSGIYYYFDDLYNSASLYVVKFLVRIRKFGRY